MTVKELKELLATADDDAVILLYDGLDEGDVYCTDAVALTDKEYCGYCQGDSFIGREDTNGPKKLFVLAGFGTCYEYINKAKNTNIHRFADCPAAEESKRKAEILRAEQEAKERAEWERKQKAFTEGRKMRYCLNFSAGGMHEANYDSLDELHDNLRNITTKSYVVYDRELGKVIESEGV